MYTLLYAPRPRENAGLLTGLLAIRRCLNNAAAIAFVALLIAACAQLPSERADDAPTVAREMAERGDHKAASREYLNMSMQASGAQKQRYLIFAAGELYLANDLESAERLFHLT